MVADKAHRTGSWDRLSKPETRREGIPSRRGYSSQGGDPETVNTKQLKGVSDGSDRLDRLDRLVCSLQRCPAGKNQVWAGISWSSGEFGALGPWSVPQRPAGGSLDPAKRAGLPKTTSKQLRRVADKGLGRLGQAWAGGPNRSERTSPRLLRSKRSKAVSKTKSR